MAENALGETLPRLLGYARSAVQEGNTLTEQTARLEAYCEVREVELVEVYSEVVSGLKVGDQFQAMRERLLQDETIDGLVVLRIDRIGRNLRKALVFLSDLSQFGKEFISVMDDIDTSTPMGRAVLEMSLVFAKLEQEQMVERVRAGFAAKKESE
jgi:DNA invertase Pin-like site-specific DNA recombinase